MADPVGTVIPAAVVPAAVVPAQVAPKPTAPAAVAPAAAPKATPAPIVPAPGQVPLSSLMEEREKRQALQTELESLRTTVNQMRQPQVQTPQPQAIQPNIKEDMDKLWQTDPRAAVEKTVYLAAQWQDNVNAQVDTEAEGLAGKYADFNDYRNTAMRYVRALPLDQRARPGIVEMAYLVTRGQNVDKIIEAQRQSLQQQFMTNPAMFQTPVGAGGAPVQTGGPTASEAEIRAAGAMKIDINEYLKWKKG